MKIQLKVVIALALLGACVNGKERTITFKNYCTQPIWFGFAGGSAMARNSASTTCGADGDCHEGTKCIFTGNMRQCFWVNPAPADNNFKLEEGESRDVNIPIYNDDGTNIIWSGAITGRTNCTNVTCETADCQGGDSGCKPSFGFMQPATQAEITFQKKDQDFYDVEIINGVHIPVSMGPSNTDISNQSYWCGNPGSKYPKTKNIGSCEWDLQPPSEDYNWVTAGGNKCNSNADCSESLCGLSFNPGHADLLWKTCGRLLGYWSADQVCGLIPSFKAPFNCENRGSDGLTNWNLMACVGTGSCYQDGAASNCCGCANWDEEGLPVPGMPDTEKCKNSNPNWHANIKGTLKWLKKACPSAYTYPFDDMSSTFRCQNMQDGVNSVNYEIAFCPQNEQKSLMEFLN